jgi:hypothetical protein
VDGKPLDDYDLDGESLGDEDFVMDGTTDGKPDQATADGKTDQATADGKQTKRKIKSLRGRNRTSLMANLCNAACESNQNLKLNYA